MNKRLGSWIGALAIIFAASLWAIDGAVLRPRLYTLDPFIVVFLEHLIVFVLISVFLIYEIKELRKLNVKDWGALFWIAIFGGAIGTLAITKAYFSVFLDNVSSISVVVLLQKTQPLFAILLAMIILKEKPKPKFFIWAFIALIGSYLIAFGFSLPDFASQKHVLYVPLFALLAAFSFGSSTVFGKHALKKINFRVATYIRFGLTSLIMFFLVASMSKFDELAKVSMSQLGTLLIIAFSTGGAAIFIYYYGLKKVMASKASIYELAYPVVAIILDFFLHQKIMNFGQWIGAFILLFSMYMITKNKRNVLVKKK